MVLERCNRSNQEEKLGSCKIIAHEFDVTSVRVLECFGWSVIVCFYVACVGDLVVSAQSQVREGWSFMMLHQEDSARLINGKSKRTCACVFAYMPARIALFVSQEIASEKKRAQGEKWEKKECV